MRNRRLLAFRDVFVEVAKWVLCRWYQCKFLEISVGFFIFLGRCWLDHRSNFHRVIFRKAFHKVWPLSSRYQRRRNSLWLRILLEPYNEEFLNNISYTNYSESSKSCLRLLSQKLSSSKINQVQISISVYCCILRF